MKKIDDLEINFKKELNLTEFCEKYFAGLVFLLNNSTEIDDKKMRKIVKNVINVQNDKTKEKLKSELKNCTTERKLTNWLYRNVMLYKIKK